MEVAVVADCVTSGGDRERRQVPRFVRGALDREIHPEPRWIHEVGDEDVLDLVEGGLHRVAYLAGVEETVAPVEVETVDAFVDDHLQHFVRQDSGPREPGVDVDLAEDFAVAVVCVVAGGSFDG